MAVGVRRVQRGGQVARCNVTSPPSEPVVEGPVAGRTIGDALARADCGQTQPTGTLATEPRRVIEALYGRRTVSGWCCLAAVGSPWPRGPGYHQRLCQPTTPPPRPQVFGSFCRNSQTVPNRCFTYSRVQAQRCTASVQGRSSALYHSNDGVRQGLYGLGLRP